MRFYCESKEEVLQKIGSSEQGLTDAEARERLAKYGPTN